MELRKKPILIKDLFPSYEGLFTKFNFDFGVSKSLLDVLFIGNYGYKNPSPFIEAIHDEDEEQMTSQELLTTASAIYALYSNKWERLKDIQGEEYDPIHNYLDEWHDESAGQEANSKTLSSTRTDTLNTTETTNSTRTDNLLSTKTINESESTTDSQADSIHGFNSTMAVPTDNSSGSGSKTNTGTDTEANTGTQGLSQTVADTGTNTRGLSENESFAGSDTRARSGSHSGNIGNITTQKMIKEEIELWRWNFIRQVLDDVAEFCTLPIYLKWRS